MSKLKQQTFQRLMPRGEKGASIQFSELNSDAPIIGFFPGITGTISKSGISCQPRYIKLTENRVRKEVLWRDKRKRIT